MSITCDFWSNRSSHSFLVLTGHFITSSFELKSTVLDFSHFDQQHTSEKISTVIHSKLNKLNLIGVVIAVTCDGAANMKKAFDKFERIDRFWCLAHRLHLIVTNGLGLWVKVDSEELNNIEDIDADVALEIDENEANIEDSDDYEYLSTNESENERVNHIIHES